MKALQKNQGRTDQMLGAMADVLTSVAMPNQQWLSEGGEVDLPSCEEEKRPVQGQWEPEGLDWEQQASTTENSDQSERTDAKPCECGFLFGLLLLGTLTLGFLDMGFNSACSQLKRRIN